MLWIDQVLLEYKIMSLNPKYRFVHWIFLPLLVMLHDHFNHMTETFFQRKFFWQEIGDYSLRCRSVSSLETRNCMVIPCFYSCARISRILLLLLWNNCFEIFFPLGLHIAVMIGQKWLCRKNPEYLAKSISQLTTRVESTESPGSIPGKCHNPIWGWSSRTPLSWSLYQNPALNQITKWWLEFRGWERDWWKMRGWDIWTESTFSLCLSENIDRKTFCESMHWLWSRHDCSALVGEFTGH
jgi:hypothetical protein